MHDNPFQPPGVHDGDFRDAAVEESRRIVEAGDGTIPANCSLCLRTGFDPHSWRHPSNWLTAVAWNFVFGGAWFALLANGPDLVWLRAISISACIGGILVLGILVSRQFRSLHRRVRVRYEKRGEGLRACRVWIAMYDARRFSCFSIADDMGYVIPNQSVGMLAIEGFRFRYLIRRQDVLSIEQLSSLDSRATAITYAVGDAAVSIAFHGNSLWFNLKKLLTRGKHDPLLAAIHETLGAGRW